MPKISVITPSYNRSGFIRTAVESVLAQNYSEFEHIIIDGSSTDSTLAVLDGYPYLRIVSEPDHGVYDALNKGIKLAGGEIIAQLNTDDYFEPNIFGMILRVFDENPAVDAISAGARIFELTSSREKTLSIYQGIKKEDLPFRITMGAPIFNAWFFRKNVFEKIGYYSSKYSLAADRDFLLRFHSAGLNHISIDKVVYHYCQHSSSLTMNRLHDSQDRVYKEMIEIADEYIVVSKDFALRRICSKWRDRVYIELFASEVLRGGFLGMTQVLYEAASKNYLWPFKLILTVPVDGIKYVAKRIAR